MDNVSAGTRSGRYQAGIVILTSGIIHFGVYFAGYAYYGKQWTSDVGALALSILPGPLIAAIIMLAMRVSPLVKSLAVGLFILIAVLLVTSVTSAFIQAEAGHISYAIAEFILFALPTLLVYVVISLAVSLIGWTMKRRPTASPTRSSSRRSVLR